MVELKLLAEDGTGFRPIIINILLFKSKTMNIIIIINNSFSDS